MLIRLDNIPEYHERQGLGAPLREGMTEVSMTGYHTTVQPYLPEGYSPTYQRGTALPRRGVQPY
eukprot:1193246-Prorocentrum_minimum.AAC.3